MGVALNARVLCSLQLFFHSDDAGLFLAGAGALVFCGFIIYDTSVLMKQLSPEEHILASINLYLDIVNLFLHILRVLDSMKKHWELQTHNLPVLWLIYACVSVDVGAPKIPLLTFVTVKTIGVFLLSSFCCSVCLKPRINQRCDYYQFFCLVKSTSTRRFMEEGHTAWFDMEPTSSSSASNAARFF